MKVDALGTSFDVTWLDMLGLALLGASLVPGLLVTFSLRGGGGRP